MRPVGSASFESDLGRLVEEYDVFCLDVWGVLQDGISALPGAIDTVRELGRRNKRIILISNTPSRATALESELAKVGFQTEIFDLIATAGEVAFQAISRGLPELEHRSEVAGRYYYVGPQERRGLLNGSPFLEVSNLESADFLLLCGFNDGQSRLMLYEKLLGDAKDRGLPMVCCSPDQFIIQNETQRIDCAGMLAFEYQARGGEVSYFGKPYQQIYDYVKQHVREGERLVSIGDTLETDVLGANRSNIDSVLLFSGVSGHLAGEGGLRALREHMAKAGVFPDYVLGNFLISP